MSKIFNIGEIVVCTKPAPAFVNYLKKRGLPLQNMKFKVTGQAFNNMISIEGIPGLYFTSRFEKYKSLDTFEQDGEE